MAEAQQNVRAEHIQLRVDKDVANVPSFYGNHKDTVTLPAFISRIDQGVETLQWTQNVAFTYFSNALKDVAAAWLECHITDNPQAPKTWAHFKPELRKAFGDTTDPVIFAQEVSNIRPEQYGNSLFKYYAAISRAVTLHQEEFVTPPMPALPEDHGLTPAQIQVFRELHNNTHNTAVQIVHAKLRKEFFLNGLPKRQLDMVVNKPYLTTVQEMIAYIHQQESIASKKNGHNSTSTTTTSVHAVLQPASTAEEPTAAAFSQSGNRSAQSSQFYRGANYRGNNGNNRGNGGGAYNRGNRGYRGNGGQFQNGRQNATSQSSSSSSQSSSSYARKTCVYCRKTGHIQDDCFVRIEKNDPCISSQGKSYFPKIHANEEQISSSSVFFLEN